jgi:Luciferase
MSEQHQIFLSAPNVRAAQVEQSVAGESMNPAAAKEAVVRAVSSWEGVTVGEHRFGGVEFRIGRRELGHLHSTIADLPFPRRIRDELIAAGKARPHHVLPNSGWITAPMRTTSEVTGVIELFRQNYDRATNVHE